MDNLFLHCSRLKTLKSETTNWNVLSMEQRGKQLAFHGSLKMVHVVMIKVLSSTSQCLLAAVCYLQLDP